MAKMTIKSGLLEIIVEGNSTFVAEQRDAFFDFLSKQEMKNESDQICQDEHVASEKSHDQRRISTWAELKEAANEGRLSELVKSGDRLPLILKNGEKVDVDVGQDESGKTFFIFHHLMKNMHCMNEELTNFGGWRNCDMHRYQNEDVFRLLPDEVQEIVVPTSIVQVIDGKRIEVRDKLFALSLTQVLGKNGLSKFEPEDSQIDLFVNQENRIKTVFGEEQPEEWWLRSPSYYSGIFFCGITTDGSHSRGSAYCPAGVTAAFFID